MHFDFDTLKRAATLVSYPKNFILVKEGTFSKKIWLLEKGAARYIYYHEQKELTGWIDTEGDVVASVYSILGLGHARETIQLLEDAELYEITLDDLRADPAYFEAFKDHMLQYYFIQLENRIKFFQSLGGKARYEYLLKHQPALLKRVPLHILSSYLGMTPESLSRIRGTLS
jgi:CRP-like cAMP-binding protein